MNVRYLETRPAHPGYHERTGYKAGCWAIVTGPTAHELDDLAEQFNLSRSQLAHVRDAEEMPRLEFVDDVTYLFIRHAATGTHGDRETSPLLAVLTRDVLLIITMRPLGQEFMPARAARTLRGTTLQLITHVLAGYHGYVGDITHRVRSLRRELHTHEISNRDLASFVTIEEELNDFVSNLEPLSAMLQRLVLARHFALTADEGETLADLILRNQQLLGACQTHLKSIESIKSAHGTIAANNLNRTIKVLTGATVLLNVPSVIFFALGMNILVPFHTSPWALPVIVAGAALVTLCVFLVFKKRRIF